MAKLKAQYPSNAFKVNGDFIEDLVPGYHTLNARGKWTLEKQLFSAEANIRDGSVFTNSRYPAREIEIEYFIEGTGWENLQAKYTALMRVLDIEDAQIIFNGESDKYIHGYFVIDDEIETSVITRAGKFKIVCPDPFKYSVTEYTAAAAGGLITATYNGTYKGYPTLIAEFPETLNGSGDNTDTSQCGYVGFANQREAVLQFGDPNETDWADVTHPATVPVNRQFKSTTGWTTNGSEVLTGTQVGTVAVSSDHIYPSGYGSGTGYHGPSLSHIITGETPPIGKNFNFSWKQKFTATKSQFGGVAAILWYNDSGTRTMVGAVQILKTTKDTKCKVSLYCGSTTAVKSYTVAVSKIGTGSMKKIDNKITFTVGGKTYTYANDGIKDLIANEITFHFLRNASKTAIGSNFIYNCQLQRTSFDNYEDVPNIFMPGQTLTVNTQDAGVYLDDGSATIQATYLGALGNDWEDFYLSPGSNTIACDYSDFTTTPPNFTLKYRERFI